MLAADPNHYNALVFLGVTAEGLDDREQALKAYKKATQKQPDQLLAWQVRFGLNPCPAYYRYVMPDRN